MQQGSAPGPAPARGGGGGGGGRGAGNATVPVTVATVSKRDLPIYLTGLGTVQASFTVAIRSQVDGKLQEVPFTEGQQVHKGDILAKIDPRLYQAALDQAKARKAQDEALLVSAKKDLIRFKTLVDKSVQTQQSLEQQQAKVDQLVASIEVVMPGDVVQARPIQSGPTTGDDTIITSGLSEGERVVINGQYKLQPNSKVTVNEATTPAKPAVAKRDRAS
jgi:multidrug efflux pump subunit AcrA (membrane-fusion protein)